MKVRSALVLTAVCLCSTAHLHSAEILRESLQTQFVEGGTLEYAVLLPDSYDTNGAELPLLLMLHGAGGDREQLVRFQPQIEAMWTAQELPEMIVAAPSVATGSIYMDSYDGKNRWESVIMTELLPHLRDKFRASTDRESTMVTGISMGGFGSLRLGFKYPETFGALAAMEPGAWPGLTWNAVPDRNKIRTPERIAALFGDPFDDQRFQQENPASIVQNAPERLRDSAIYIEVGDEDFLGFMEGVDFLHRLLWRHRLQHEFRLVRWADHTGSTIMERSHDRFRFLARFLAQPTDPEPALTRQRERIAAGHTARGIQPFGYWPNSTLRSYDTSDGGLNYRRALRDSQEVREERGVIRIADIAYNEHPGVDPQRQSLDLYLREGLTDAPVVLYVHGGSWVRGDKARALFKPAALVPEGYLFASMNYRFRPTASLAEMAQDVATAAAWLKRHAAKYGGDGSRVALMGHSAGAHLVAAVGTNEAFMEAAGATLADLSGVVAIDTAMYNVPLQMENPGAAHTNAFGTDRAAWMPVSPWHHIEAEKGIPPFLLFVSDGRPAMHEQVLPLQAKFRDAGVEAIVHESKGRAHSPLDTYLGVDGDESTVVLIEFLARQLGG
jgi:acetyl esterase/lipase/enterochelin esterase-like enzyme